MPYLIGILLALAVGAYATAMRLDRDRAFYPSVLIVVASYYVLFAIMDGSVRTVVIESLIMGGFVLAASVGFQRNLWLVVAALAVHGVLDLVHARVVANPAVPGWWPGWCMSFDVVAGAYLAWRLASVGAARTSYLPTTLVEGTQCPPAR
jgi:hypothetical protein